MIFLRVIVLSIITSFISQSVFSKCDSKTRKIFENNLMLSSKGAQDVFCQTNESLGDIFDCSYAVLKKRLASKNLKEKFKTFFHRKESLANASVSCIKGEYTEKLEGGCEKAMRNYMFIIRKPLRLSICDGKNKAKNVINCVTKKFKASGKLMRQNKELKRVLQECTRKKSSV